MADRYWVGGTWNWDASTTTNWSTSTGGAWGASVPTSADNVIFDQSSSVANAAYTVTITATANCLDFTMDWPHPTDTNKVTWAWSSALNIFGSINMSGWTAWITRTYTWIISFASTSTGKTITSNWISFASGFTFSWAWWEWIFQDNHVNTQGFTHQRGTVDTNGKTITCNSIFWNNSNTRTLTLGSSTINCSWIWWNSTTWLTFNEGTSIIKLDTTGTLAWLWETFYEVQFNWTAHTITGANTFTNLIRTWTAAKTDSLTLAANQTVTWTFTATGNSAINRILIKSDTRWTARTITAAAISVDMVDFQDITGAGAASWDMSAAAWYTGDCGGNSMKALGTAAFTTAATCNWSAGTTWSTATWSNHSVPLPQDTATFTTAGTVTITQDMPRIGSVDFSTVSGAKTWTTSTACSVFGSINLTNLTTLTSSGQTYSFEGRWSNTLTSAGFTWWKQFNTRMVWGSITLNDNFISTAAVGINAETWTLNANWNYTAPSFSMNNVGTKTINMGSWTWKLNGTGTVWSLFATWLTINPSTSTIKCTNNSASNITFSGWWFTYNNLWFARSTATWTITIAWSNTFSDFKDDGSVAHSILFTAWTTQTVSTFTVSGTAGNVITLNSTTTGTFTLTAPSRSNASPVSCDYLNIQHCICSQSNTWYAWVNSVNNQATATAGSGWIFTAPVLNNWAWFLLMI